MQRRGWTEGRVKAELAKRHQRDLSYEGGEVLGSMCSSPLGVARFAHALFLETNLGDPVHFPGARGMEEEVLADLGSLLHAPAKASGRFVSGGTEANLLACHLARERSGKKTVVVPDSAHFSFSKAARLLGMRLRTVETLPSGHADVKALEAACDADTALVVAVAGTTELGLVDPVGRIAAMARRKRIPLHVDAAFGGYLLPFLPDSAPFDFQVPGVWSVAIDPHKMGLGTIPAGILFLRDGADWELGAVESPYVSTESQSTLLGTRPGAAVAAIWAAHRRLGRVGYERQAATCMANARFLARRLDEAGFPLVSPPELNVVTFRHDRPKLLARRLQKRRFGVNVIPRLNAIRIVVGPHVTRPALERFMAVLAGET
ncbi:MAG: tyrosine decarboxylase MfnA [Thermoplasmatota archaeon]